MYLPPRPNPHRHRWVPVGYESIPVWEKTTAPRMIPMRLADKTYIIRACECTEVWVQEFDFGAAIR